MIVIHTFMERIPPAEGEGRLVQAFFMHWLFPKAIPKPEADFAKRRGGVRTYQQVAMLGYYAALSDNPTFSEGCRWLKGIRFPEDLLAHGEALLGIALGIRSQRDIELREWYLLDVLPKLPKSALSSGWESFLRVIANWKLPLINLVDAEAEYELSAPFLLRTETPPTQKILATYLTHMRKQAYPYYDDFVRTMLAVYVMDRALEHCIWDPQQMQQFKAGIAKAARQGVLERLESHAYRVARRRVAAGIIGSIGITCALSALTFGFFGNANALKDAWEDSKWIFLLWGGPLAALTYLARLAWFWRTGKTLKGDYIRMAEWLGDRLHERWRKRLGLNALPDPDVTHITP